MMTKKIFSVVLLCLFFYACAGSQTNPDNVQSTTPDNAKSASSDAAVNNQAQDNKGQPTSDNKNIQLSTPAVQYLYIIKDTKMRKSARNTSKVIVALKKGATVEKIDSSKYWVKVKTDSGKTGWVSNKLVSENK